MGTLSYSSRLTSLTFLSCRPTHNREVSLASLPFHIPSLPYLRSLGALALCCLVSRNTNTHICFRIDRVHHRAPLLHFPVQLVIAWHSGFSIATGAFFVYTLFHKVGQFL